MAEFNSLDLLDQVVDLTSPLSSVDATSKDRIMVQEELERRLKHRAGRQDLVQRNILPPLSLPTAPKLFTQSQQLQRAKIADNIQKKLRNRPDRTNLQQLNILPDLHFGIDPGLQAKQVQLMKNKKVDSLNEKLANRPGPIQLLKDHILEPGLAAVIEDASFQSLEPENDKSQDLPSISLQRTASESCGAHSIATSAGSQLNVASPTKEAVSPLSLEAQRRKMSDSSLSPANSPSNDDSRSPPVASPRGFNSTYPPLTMPSLNPAHTAMLSSGPGKAPSPSQTRKKQQKNQKYRKLRYHEYVPPTKSTPKGGKQTPKTPPKSNSPYDLLLQQQQLFLHLQVLHQSGTSQKLPDLVGGLSKEQKSMALAAMKAGRIPISSAVEMPINMSKQLGSAQHLPQIINVDTPNKQNISSIRFDDLKVQDLKAACKELGIIVSGKKAELVERLLESNKRLLPARALPDSSKDARRHAFSIGATSSIDSQLSSSSPPSPTSSPVFTYPAEHNGSLQHSQSYTTIKNLGSNAPMRMESLPTMFPEVFPASTLQQEFEEMIQQQKRNYISNPQKGSVKNLAPCPDLNELVAIKLPPYPQQAPPTYQQSVNKATKGSASQGERSPHSLPSSPVGPDTMLNEFMDDSTNTPSSLATTSNGLVTGAANESFLGTSSGKSVMATAGMFSERPARASVPEGRQVKVHPVHPPSYEATLQRSISLSGPHPTMGHMHGVPSFNGEVVNTDGMMLDMEMPMDTADSNFSDLFDILKADGTGFSSQPQSLPPTLSHPHSSHPHFSSPTKMRQDSLQTDSIMLGSQNKSLNGSDLCLSIPSTHDNHNSMNNYNVGNNVMLGNDLGWLDLENTGGNNFPFTTGFGNMGSQSNPGSLPHDQFQYMDENGGSNYMKVSSPLNGMVNQSNDLGPFLDAGLQSGLLVQTDEKTLVELGLSTSS